MEIARYEKRLTAYLIDLLLAFAPPLVLSIILYARIPSDINPPLYFYFLAVELVTYALFVFFSFFVLIISRGYTIGALIMGIKVIHPNRVPLTAREAFLRSITIGVLPMVLANAVYMIAVHTERTIFDRISETVVVDYRHR